MLLLCTGLETDLDTLRGMRRPAAMVSVLGIAIPFAGGFLLGWWLPAAYLPADNQRLIFALFMAVAMSISAVPVIAKILIDLDLMRREIGVLILAAGVLDDLVGWILLSVVAGLATRGTVRPPHALEHGLRGRSLSAALLLRGLSDRSAGPAMG